MRSLREELELRRKTEIHEIEEVHQLFIIINELLIDLLFIILKNTDLWS